MTEWRYYCLLLCNAGACQHPTRVPDTPFQGHATVKQATVTPSQRQSAGDSTPSPPTKVTGILMNIYDAHTGSTVRIPQTKLLQDLKQAAYEKFKTPIANQIVMTSQGNQVKQTDYPFSDLFVFNRAYFSKNYSIPLQVVDAHVVVRAVHVAVRNLDVQLENLTKQFDALTAHIADVPGLAESLIVTQTMNGLCTSATNLCSDVKSWCPSSSGTSTSIESLRLLQRLSIIQAGLQNLSPKLNSLPERVVERYVAFLCHQYRADQFSDFSASVKVTRETLSEVAEHHGFPNPDLTSILEGRDSPAASQDDSRIRHLTSRIHNLETLLSRATTSTSPVSPPLPFSQTTSVQTVSLRKELVEANHLINSMRSDILNTTQDLESERANRADLLANLKQTNTSFESERKNMAQEIESLQKRIEEQIEESENAKSTEESLLGDLKQANDLNTSILAEIGLVKGENAQLKEQLAALTLAKDEALVQQETDFRKHLYKRLYLPMLSEHCETTSKTLASNTPLEQSSFSSPLDLIQAIESRYHAVGQEMRADFCSLLIDKLLSLVVPQPSNEVRLRNNMPLDGLIGWDPSGQLGPMALSDVPSERIAEVVELIAQNIRGTQVSIKSSEQRATEMAYRHMLSKLMPACFPQERVRRDNFIAPPEAWLDANSKIIEIPKTFSEGVDMLASAMELVIDGSSSQSTKEQKLTNDVRTLFVTELVPGLSSLAMNLSKSTILPPIPDLQAEALDVPALRQYVTGILSAIQHNTKKYIISHNKSRQKISYRSFAPGDLALFLPTRNQKSGLWAAFNVNAPHYFLDAEGIETKGRDFVIGRITKIDERNGEPDQDGGAGLDDEGSARKWWEVKAVEKKRIIGKRDEILSSEGGP